MTREQVDKLVWEMLAKQIGLRPASIEDYWVTARGLRVRYWQPGRFGRELLPAEHTIPMPRAEAQALVDAGGE